MTPEEHFVKLVPPYMHMFKKDFDASTDDASAVFGNGGYESLGFTKLQEMNPRAGRGGWGLFQWTGPRRKQFEAYCQRNNLDPSSLDTNYKFLFVELTSTEKKAIPALKGATTLEAKVKAFENAFERAGVKAYAKRVRWAKIAKEAYEAWSAIPIPEEPKKAPVEAPKTPQKRFKISLLGLLISLWKVMTK